MSSFGIRILHRKKMWMSENCSTDNKTLTKRIILLFAISISNLITSRVLGSLSVSFPSLGFQPNKSELKIIGVQDPEKYWVCVYVTVASYIFLFRRENVRYCIVSYNTLENGRGELNCSAMLMKRINDCFSKNTFFHDIPDRNKIK